MQGCLMTQATRPRRLMAPPDHPHNTQHERPVTKVAQNKASTRDATALLLASETCYVPHILMRISARTPR